MKLNALTLFGIPVLLLNSSCSPSTQAGTAGTQERSALSSTVLNGASCTSGDPDHLCLAIHFVAYEDSNGVPAASAEESSKILQTLNRLWKECNIGFQIEKYEKIDPSEFNLSYGADSQSQTDRIRSAFSSPANNLLAVTTGPWDTAVNAWTSMPGEGNYGAIMEAGIVHYGEGIIYAHEFGHYLGLDHVSDISNLMNAVIYTDSTAISADQCRAARKSAHTYWSAMLR